LIGLVYLIPPVKTRQTRKAERITPSGWRKPSCITQQTTKLHFSAIPFGPILTHFQSEGLMSFQINETDQINQTNQTDQINEIGETDENMTSEDVTP
jgi:hypothetical protein